MHRTAATWSTLALVLGACASPGPVANPFDMPSGSFRLSVSNHHPRPAELLGVSDGQVFPVGVVQPGQNGTFDIQWNRARDIQVLIRVGPGRDRLMPAVHAAPGRQIALEIDSRLWLSRYLRR